MKTLNIELVDSQHPLFAKIIELKMPTNKTEQYKKFAIKPLLGHKYHIKMLEQKSIKEAKNLVITNGVVSESPRGLALSFKNDFSCDSKHYDVLYFYSHSLCSSVIYIEISENIEFEIKHIFNEKETFLPYRIVIKTVQGIEATIFENFLMKGSDKSLLMYGLDIDIAQRSTINWIRDAYVKENEATVIGTHHYNVSKEGALKLNTFDFGSANALHLYKIDLDAYAWTHASHLLLPSGAARRGNVVHINHNKEYAKSIQEARSILQDTSLGIFDSKIRVDSQARYSNARQNSKAILLSENAHMYAKPQLEIYIDELEASHGSTIGELDEEALFYLSSRGVSLEKARSILVMAFAETLIDSIGQSQYIQKIHVDFEAGLRSLL